MGHVSVKRFTPLSKRLIISIPLFLSVLLMGGIGVEASVETCGTTDPALNDPCYCERNETGIGTLVLLNCSGVNSSYTGSL